MLPIEIQDRIFWELIRVYLSENWYSTTLDRVIEILEYRPYLKKRFYDWFVCDCCVPLIYHRSMRSYFMKCVKYNTFANGSQKLCIKYVHHIESPLQNYSYKFIDNFKDNDLHVFFESPYVSRNISPYKTPNRTECWKYIKRLVQFCMRKDDFKLILHCGGDPINEVPGDYTVL